MVLDIYQRIMYKINVNSFKSENWEVIESLLEIVKKLKFTEEEIEEAGLDEQTLKWDNHIKDYNIDLTTKELELLFNEVFVLFNNKKSDIFMLIKIYNEIFESRKIGKETETLTIKNFEKFEAAKNVLLSTIEEETSVDVLKSLSRLIVETNVINEEFLESNGVSFDKVDDDNVKINDNEVDIDIEINKNTFDSLKTSIKSFKFDVNSYGIVKEVFPNLFTK